MNVGDLKKRLENVPDEYEIQVRLDETYIDLWNSDISVRENILYFLFGK